MNPDKPAFKTHLTKIDDQQKFDCAYWREAGAAAIWDAGAEMTREYYLMKGILPMKSYFKELLQNLPRRALNI